MENQSNEGVSLRVAYGWIVVIAMIISGLMFYGTYSLLSNIESLKEAMQNQIAMDKAVHQLMDASDYLTERVQRFTVNGDIKFLNEYFDEAFKTKNREEAIAKISRFSDATVAIEEIQQGMRSSLALMNREYYIMRLVADAKGYTELPKEVRDVKLSAQDSGLSAEAKMELATQMALDEEYYKLKDDIRLHMKECHSKIEFLTHHAEHITFNSLKDVLNTERFIILLQIIVTLLLIWLTIRLGIAPILKAVEDIRADKPIEETGAREFRYLAHAYNSISIQLNLGNERLKDISMLDSLTGVKNRTALKNDYESYHGREVSVMLMDIDNFKKINNEYGHGEADRVLIETGKRLAEKFDKKYCYRFGADEFLVILPDQSEADFLRKLENVIDERPSVSKNGVTSKVEYSVGYVHAVLIDDLDPRDFIADADHKLYEVKRKKLHGDIADANHSLVSEKLNVTPDSEQIGVVNPLGGFLL